MGQDWISIVLDADCKVVAWMAPCKYGGSGGKLMEHSYIGNEFVSTFEFGLSPQGRYHKSRVVWAGDYADKEPDQEEHNLYSLCNEDKKNSEITPRMRMTLDYPFVVNHSKKLFVDKRKALCDDYYDDEVHPLPILTAEGNGRGGGDYDEVDPPVGTWARDVISVEKTAPKGYEELMFYVQE